MGTKKASGGKVKIPTPWRTKEEIADFYKVSQRTVNAWMASGSISYLRLPGGHVRFNADVVAQELAQREVRAAV